ncbi:MAG: hypothetical protein ABSD39_16070 [Terriglobales bacterium]
MQRLALLMLFICAAMAAFSNTSHAQQIDAAVGGGSIFAPAGSTATGDHQPQSLGGAAYATGSVDYLFFRKKIGVEVEAAVREDTGTYAQNFLNIPFRPMFFDGNAIWVTPLRKRIALEVEGGGGVLNTRFQTQFCTSSKCYANSTHPMGDVGGGIKLYAWRRLFIRPEGRFYLINNNTEFSSGHALRYGFSIGYTFRAPRP